MSALTEKYDTALCVLRIELSEAKTTFSTQNEAAQSSINDLNSQISANEVIIAEHIQKHSANESLISEQKTQIETFSEQIALLTKEISALNGEVTALQETAARTNVQMAERDEALQRGRAERANMSRESALLSAKLKVSIKEIIKLRAESERERAVKGGLLDRLSALLSKGNSRRGRGGNGNRNGRK